MNPGPGPSVSIVVPVRNGERTLRRCLTALLRAERGSTGVEIVVVDNGSTDATAAIARECGVRSVFEPRRGLSHARNRGIRDSRGEVLVFIDADCFVTTRWLVELLEGVRPPAAVATGEVLAFLPSTPAERYAAVRKPYWQASIAERSAAAPWCLFGNAAVRREVFDRLGLFDTRFQGAVEDIDFSWRLFDAGCRWAYRPRAIAFHEHRQTPLALFQQHRGYGRNQAVLSRKYPDRLAWGWRRELGAWADLAATARRVLVATDAVPAGPMRSAEYRRLDFVRKMAQRVGFLEGLGAALVRRAREAEGSST